MRERAFDAQEENQEDYCAGCIRVCNVILKDGEICEDREEREKMDYQTERKEIVGGLEIIRRPWKNDGAWITIYKANRKPGILNPKPILNLSFGTPEQAEERIREAIDVWIARDEEKHGRAKARREYRHTLKVGDILCSSWGYDQTNVDFYQVVAVPSVKSITIRKIGLDLPRGEEGFMCGYSAVPMKDRFTGEPFTKRVTTGGSVKLTSYSYAWLWNGKEKYVSWYA